MGVLIELCNYSGCTLIKMIKHRPLIMRLYSSRILFPSYTDDLVENLIMEAGNKQESRMSKYLKNVCTEDLLKISVENKRTLGFERPSNIKDLVCFIEKEMETKIIPNEKLLYFLVYFTKDGNINGVKAVQSVVEKHNANHFKSHSQYNHYLAEAYWMNGKIHVSLQLFSAAYDNRLVKPKVRIMLTSLFPLLMAQHSEATLHKAINDIELFSSKKQDDLILACLWRELFCSSWFSDQEQAIKLLQKNKHLLMIIQWMVPAIGKNFLRSHRIDDFYRLMQFTLENKFQSMTGALLRFMFEYYYIHENIERCTAVVKYSANLNLSLTDEQQRRYVKLLLRTKDAASSKFNIKKPQNLKYEF